MGNLNGSDINSNVTPYQWNNYKKYDQKGRYQYNPYARDIYSDNWDDVFYSDFNENFRNEEFRNYYPKHRGDNNHVSRWGW
jgi:hypothetical protein